MEKKDVILTLYMEFADTSVEAEYLNLENNMGVSRVIVPAKPPYSNLFIAYCTYDYVGGGREREYFLEIWFSKKEALSSANLQATSYVAVCPNNQGVLIGRGDSKIGMQVCFRPYMMGDSYSDLLIDIQQKARELWSKVTEGI